MLLLGLLPNKGEKAAKHYENIVNTKENSNFCYCTTVSETLMVFTSFSNIGTSEWISVTPCYYCNHLFLVLQNEKNYNLKI